MKRSDGADVSVGSNGAAAAMAPVEAVERRVLRIEPSRGWVSLKLKELWEHRELLFFFTWRDIKVRYKQTALGAAWAVIQPFFTMLVFSLFFGRLAKMPSDGIPYPVFSYAALVPSVFPGGGMVPLNYGGYHLEGGDASGAWVSSTVDLLRFVGGVDGRADRPDILSAGTVAEMTKPGPLFPCATAPCYYGAGWWVHLTQGDATWQHGGDLPSSTALLVRSTNNTSWVALFNSNQAAAGFDAALEAALRNALPQVTSFPTHDLFPAFQ